MSTPPKLLQEELPGDEPDEVPIAPAWDEATIAQLFPDLMPGPEDPAKAREAAAKAEALLGSGPSRVKIEDILDPSLSLYDAFMLEAERQIIVDAEKHLPLNIASIGCHVANLYSMPSCGHVEFGDPPQRSNNPRCVMNGRKQTLTSVSGGKRRDLRMFLMTIGPPGSGKGEVPMLFVDRVEGLLPGSVIPRTFIQTITRPALFGSGTRDPRNPNKIVYDFGLAWKYCSGIVACEEMSFIKSAAEASFSVGFEDSFLTFAEKGFVEVNLRDAKFSYSVGTTGWFGNQSDRIWTGTGESGFTRRMCSDFNFMTEELDARLKVADKLRRQVAPSSRVRDHFARRIRYLFDNFKVETLDFEHADAYNDLIESYKMGAATGYTGFRHYENHMMDRIAIGYNIMRYWEPSMRVLPIKLDDTLKRIIERQVAVRRLLFRGRNLLSNELVLRLQRRDGRVRRSDILEEMHTFGGYSVWKVERELEKLVKMGRLRLEGNTWDPSVTVND